MFRSFGAPEIILVLVIILIFFGVGKLPQVGAALGKGIRAFRGGESDAENEEDTPAATAGNRPRKAA